MLNLLIYIVVVCLVIGLVYWIIDVIPIPEPMNKIAKVLVIVIGCIALIYALMGIAGTVPTLKP